MTSYRSNGSLLNEGCGNCFVAHQLCKHTLFRNDRIFHGESNEGKADISRANYLASSRKLLSDAQVDETNDHQENEDAKDDEVKADDDIKKKDPDRNPADTDEDDDEEFDYTEDYDDDEDDDPLDDGEEIVYEDEPVTDTLDVASSGDSDDDDDDG
ncbi:hypothetical protein QAD02_015685 [Eretmocerus hayati]|uniref:Uncharacterized protein n=1 Tax=Eretmocerus hayati TaxID=131215 RepID=A0ACC2P903_9HYME|nr:hypothetical protein QAD02_015685 [Eretmocerus hayati]